MTSMPDHPQLQEIQSLISEALQVPEELVSSDLTFGDLPQWDSLGHMEILMRLEEKYGLEVNAETIAVLVSIPEILKYINERN